MHERRTALYCARFSTLISTSFSATIPDPRLPYLLPRARTCNNVVIFSFRHQRLEATHFIYFPLESHWISQTSSRSHRRSSHRHKLGDRAQLTYTHIMEYQAPTPSIQAAFATESSPLPPPPSPPPAPQSQPQQQQQQQPIITEPFVGTSIKSMKIAAESSLREYAALQKQGAVAGGGNERLRPQGGLAASDLRALRAEVTAVLKRAQNERWRKWLLGGIVAAIIPAVRKIFRRSSSDDHVSSSNDTEHAFRKSKSLIARILDSVHVEGKSGFASIASIAFFVLAVLYVFQNEVSLRVARTVSKRLKTLVSKVEDGVEDVGEQDFKILNGWRWRVLLW
ncbi:hypothetical protein F5B22DRAFT_388965 [Xylaria bambusicola]|uniref:uncharacterized protein n=1 Tax=Xylaria bambusicola TaxID=326684 RepID=UPI0020072475|nr:uncharacterized protein F5B22DRAFT_388965 [Xylaria bambusicola]KAI0508709.1 hypothetical protein F5B22DRAFT_388965 [Xylaria bambusicola]